MQSRMWSIKKLSIYFSGVHPAITLRYMGADRKLVAAEVLQIEIHGDWSTSEMSLALFMVMKQYLRRFDEVTSLYDITLPKKSFQSYVKSNFLALSWAHAKYAKEPLVLSAQHSKIVALFWILNIPHHRCCET